MFSKTIFDRYFIFFLILTSVFSFSQSQFDRAFADSKRATTHKFKLEFTDTSGNETSLPVLIIKGKQTGKVFTLLAGVHGFEYPPIIAIQDMIQELNPEELSGTLIVLPITNMGSFYTRTPYINPLDKKNINRIFPGDDEGTVSEQIVDFISTKIIPVSDVFLDIHSGDASEDLLPFVCYYENKNYPEITQKTKELSEFSGFEYVVSYPYTIKEDEPAKYAFKQACQVGKIALSFESGKLGNVQPEAVKRIKTGLYRLLQKLEMFDSKVAFTSPKIKKLNNQIYVRSTVQGIFYSAFKAGDEVVKGEVVGYITDEFGEQLEEIVTPRSGTILYMKGTPPTNSNDSLMCVSFLEN